MAFWNRNKSEHSTEKSAVAVSPRRGWWPVIMEAAKGNWQRNIEVKAETALGYHAVFSCVTLIASDIAKLRPRVIKRTADGIWVDQERHSLNSLLRKPNNAQTGLQFWEAYFISKLSTGNTYVWKRKDSGGKVVSLHVLNPMLVQLLVAPQGAVFYQLSPDDVSGITETVTIPASEIIHDRFNCLYHPLVGMSPIYANGLAALQGLAIQKHSENFFVSGSFPSGVLKIPDKISDEDAAILAQNWIAMHSREKAGSVAVLSEGVDFQPLAIPAGDAQLIEQLKWSAEVVCSTFHVPPYKIGLGTMPSYNNIQALNVEYYSQCLQTLIESAEDVMDEGFGLAENVGVEFNVDNLLRMDGMTFAMKLKEEVGAGIRAPNEARRHLNLPPVLGGETPYLQQQNHSLRALSVRDAREDPFSSSKPEVKPDGPPVPASEQGKALDAIATKAAEIFSHAV